MIKIAVIFVVGVIPEACNHNRFVTNGPMDVDPNRFSQNYQL